MAPRTAFDRINRLRDRHGITPVIDRVDAFHEALQAFEHLSVVSSARS